MTDEFQKIQEAFEQATALTGEARDAFVADLTKKDPALAAQLERLIQVDGQTGQTLASPIRNTLQELTESWADPQVDRMIGPWKVIERIGSGGMGTVFRAARNDGQFEQEAALKIMAMRMMSDEAVARFKAERQILAQLNHPNIARLIDGGTTDDELPYLVMELVDGIPIDQYCDQQRMSVRERLKTFLTLCSVVDHAHRNLIVHRDLKPSNILLTADGDLKLLDFGIAKLLREDTTQDPSAFALTPEYASPEQIAGDTISVATDVYALGVLLYRLLTATSPYQQSVSSGAGLEEAVLKTVPPAPSKLISMLSSEPTRAGDETLALPLRHRISDDLDCIVLKCLEKDPLRRYKSVQQLIDDIERYLSGQAVDAHPSTLLYRTKKFCVRNIHPLATAAALTIAGLSFLSYHTIRLGMERDRAEAAAIEANAVSDFLIDIFRNADPFETDGSPQSAIALLREAETQIEQLDGDTPLQSSLNQIMGDVFTGIGDNEASLRLLNRARETWEADPSVDPLKLADVYHSLSEAHRLSPNLPQAEEFIRKSLAIREKVLEPNDDVIVRSLTRLGVNLSDQQRKAEALELLEEAHARKLLAGGPPDSLLVDIIGNKAHVLNNLELYDEARKAHQEVVPLSEAVDGPLNPNTIIRIMNKGRFESSTYEYDQAIQTMAEALRRAEQVWTPDKPILARWYATLAYTRTIAGQFDQALQENRKAIELAIIARGDGSDLHLSTRRRYAQTLTKLGHYDEARAIHEDLISKAIDLHGGDTRSTDFYRFGLVEIALLQDGPDEAEGLLAGRIRRMEAGDVSPWRRALILSSLGEIRSRQERYGEADKIFADLIAERETAEGTNSFGLVRFLLPMAEHALRKGAPDDADRHFARAAALTRERFPEGNGTLGKALIGRAKAQLSLQNLLQAHELSDNARMILSQTFSQDHPLILEARKVQEDVANARALQFPRRQ